MSPTVARGPSTTLLGATGGFRGHPCTYQASGAGAFDHRKFDPGSIWRLVGVELRAISKVYPGSIGLWQMSFPSPRRPQPIDPVRLQRGSKQYQMRRMCREHSLGHPGRRRPGTEDAGGRRWARPPEAGGGRRASEAAGANLPRPAEPSGEGRRRQVGLREGRQWSCNKPRSNGSKMLYATVGQVFARR